MSLERKPNIKWKPRVSVADNQFCKNYSGYNKFYDADIHFCSTTSSSCRGDNPVMGIDMTDPDKPYWYVFGLFHYVKRCFNSPQTFTKIIPIMDWIENIINSN